MLQKSVLGVFSAPPSFPSCQPGSWPPPKPAVGTGALGRGRDRTPPRVMEWDRGISGRRVECSRCGLHRYRVIAEPATGVEMS